jgi:hypothetical protein
MRLNELVIQVTAHLHHKNCWKLCRLSKRPFTKRENNFMSLSYFPLRSTEMQSFLYYFIIKAINILVYSSLHINF